MGKRRVGFKTKKDGVDRLRNAADSDEELTGRGRGHGAGGVPPEHDLDSFLDDEIDKYNNQKEQESRKDKRRGRDRKRQQAIDSDDEEQEIYGLNVSSADEDDGEDDGGMIEDSEDEGAGRHRQRDGDDDEESEDEEDDDNDEDILKGGRDEDLEGRIPDSRAWGKRARVFHSTDYVDQDFGGFEGSDAELAQQEEDEAKEIQKRLTAELDEADFMDFLPAAAAATPAASEKLIGRKSKEVLTLDLDNLSAAERRRLVERECPEVIHLLDEYKEKLNAAIATKKAQALARKDGDISDELDPETKLLNDYLMTKYLCLLNYCINISYFLYLRSTSPASCKGHPVIKVVLQYRRLLDELNTFKSSKRQAIEGDLADAIPTKKLKTKIVSKRPAFEFADEDDEEASEDESELDDQEMGLIERVKKKVDVEGDEEENSNALDEESKEHEKRAITREMAKNKGLTPKRKKEQRNPRVKHREKFRKAKIRRRGQVRTPRTEVKKYDGEAYGIKSHITKSIKLK